MVLRMPGCGIWMMLRMPGCGDWMMLRMPGCGDYTFLVVWVMLHTANDSAHHG